MRLSFLIYLCLAAYLTAGAADRPELKRFTPVPENEPIPTIDFFRPPRFNDPELSPSGSHFAATLSQDDGVQDLIVCEIASKKRTITSAGLFKGNRLNIEEPHWMGDRNLIFYVSLGGVRRFGLYSCSIDNAKHPEILVRTSYASLLSIPNKTPLNPYVCIDFDWYGEAEDSRVLQIDGEHSNLQGAGLGSTTILASTLNRLPTPERDTFNTYMANREGAPSIALNVKEGKESLYRFENNKWIPCPLSVEDWDVVGPADDDNEIVVAGAEAAGAPRALHTANIKTGKILSKLHSDKEYDLQSASLVQRRSDGRVMGLCYHRKTLTYVWFDPEYKALHEGLQQAFPQMDVYLTDTDLAGKRILFAVASSTQPTKFYLLDKATGTIAPLGETRPWIDPKRMRPKHPLSFVGRDGVLIDAYLTLPQGADQKSLPPLVVIPHSSHRGRDTMKWDALVQFLASRGYAVLQVNYRGSWGYDLRWPKDERWAFHKMSHDVTDAVNYLIQQGAADRNKIGLLGGEFGAQIALSAITDDPTLYKCAITVSGIFDWNRYMKEARRYDYTNDRYNFLRYHLGDPAKEKAKFEAMSPLLRVGRIVSPMLVIYGTSDRVSGGDQGYRLANALKGAKVPYESLMLDDYGPNFTLLGFQLKWVEAVDAFLAKNLPVTKR